MTDLGYLDDQPSREQVDAMPGEAVLEFGANWCGICRAAKPAIDEVLAELPDVPRIKAADGPGLPLGRSFRVKLWPTLILLRDGVEVGRVVRPSTTTELREALTQAGFSGR